MNMEISELAKIKRIILEEAEKELQKKLTESEKELIWLGARKGILKGVKYADNKYMYGCKNPYKE